MTTRPCFVIRLTATGDELRRVRVYSMDEDMLKMQDLEIHYQMDAAGLDFNAYHVCDKEIVEAKMRESGCNLKNEGV